MAKTDFGRNGFHGLREILLNGAENRVGQS
jgi:hypothetical protein